MPALIRNKQLFVVSQLAAKQGWDVEMTGGGHLKWTAPDGKIVFTSSTPKGDDGVRKAIADLERFGLVCNKAEYRRMIKDTPDMDDRVIDLGAITDEERNAHAVELAAVSSLNGGDQELYQMGRGMQTHIVDAMVLGLDPNDGGPPCEGCGKADFVAAIGAISHRKKCDDYQRWLTVKAEEERELVALGIAGALCQIGPYICLGLAATRPAVASESPTSTLTPEPDPTEQETPVARPEPTEDSDVEDTVDALLATLLEGADVKLTVENLKLIRRWTDATTDLLRALHGR